MRRLLTPAAGLLALALPAGSARATSSTTYFTPMTLDIQAPGVFHIGIDNYVTVARKSADGAGSFPTDFTLPEIGFALSSKVFFECGADYFPATDNPWFFNAKVALVEDALFAGQPTLQIGIYNVGTKASGPAPTNFDIGFLVVGKTLGKLGRFSAGPYWGNHATMVSSAGKSQNVGFMVAWDHGFVPARDKDGNDFSRIVVAGDYASGKNVIGGGGAGLYYFFTKDISLLAGPVWFNDSGINGPWKVTVQLDINLPKLF